MRVGCCSIFARVALDLADCDHGGRLCSSEGRRVRRRSSLKLFCMSEILWDSCRVSWVVIGR